MIRGNRTDVVSTEIILNLEFFLCCVQCAGDKTTPKNPDEGVCQLKIIHDVVANVLISIDRGHGHVEVDTNLTRKCRMENVSSNAK